MSEQPSIYRRKLLNAVLFFAKNTKHLNTGKISKLLYFLDFTHFKETGYPSIGLQYYTFERGPVPKDFWLEIKDGNVPQDFKGKLELVKKVDESALSRKEIEIWAIGRPDLSVFSPREKRILETLALIYKDARARDMMEVTHLPNEPWETTIKKSGKNAPIDYLLGIDEKAKISKDEAKESLKEHFDAVRNFGIAPTK